MIELTIGARRYAIFTEPITFDRSISKILTGLV
jgi:hypothetical protein